MNPREANKAYQREAKVAEKAAKKQSKGKGNEQAGPSDTARPSFD